MSLIIPLQERIVADLQEISNSYDLTLSYHSTQNSVRNYEKKMGAFKEEIKRGSWVYEGHDEEEKPQISIDRKFIPRSPKRQKKIQIRVLKQSLELTEEKPVKNRLGNRIAINLTNEQQRQSQKSLRIGGRKLTDAKVNNSVEHRRYHNPTQRQFFTRQRKRTKQALINLSSLLK